MSSLFPITRFPQIVPNSSGYNIKPGDKLLGAFLFNDNGGAAPELLTGGGSTTILPTWRSDPKGPSAYNFAYPAPVQGRVWFNSGSNPQFAAAAWIRVVSVPGATDYPTITAVGTYNNEADQNGWIFYIGASADVSFPSKFVFGLRNDSASGFHAGSATSVAANTDYFLFGQGDGNGYKKIYVNGILDGTSNNSPFTMKTPTGTIFGNDGSNGSGAANVGASQISVYSIGVWNRVFQDAEIWEMYQRGRGGMFEFVQRQYWSLGDVALSLSLSDALSFSDAITAGAPISGLGALSDTLAFNDTISLRMADTIALADALSFSDNLSSATGVVEGLSDTLAFNDAIALFFTYRLLFIDTIALSDGVKTAAQVYRELSDLLLFTDEILTFVTNSPHFSDTLAISDQMGMALGVVLHPADAISITDSINIGLAAQINIGLSDTLVFTDGAAAEIPTAFNSYIRRYLNDVLL